MLTNFRCHEPRWIASPTHHCRRHDRFHFLYPISEPGMIFEVQDDASEPFQPAAVVSRCIERGAVALLLDRSALPATFFDLSSGQAGDLLHRLSLYRIPGAAVVPDPERFSKPFQDFAREANRGRHFRFFPSRAEAVLWLESQIATA